MSQLAADNACSITWTYSQIQVMVYYKYAETSLKICITTNIMAYEELNKDQHVEALSDQTVGLVFAGVILVIAGWRLFRGEALMWCHEYRASRG
jgi:hypothetical protein